MFTMKTGVVLAGVLFAIAAAPSRAQVTAWQIDSAHSAAHFSVRHMMVTNVRGEFSKLTGVVTLDEKDMTRSSVEVTIDATTINTREGRRDEHLRSPDFFDVAKFPTLSFRSKSVTPAGTGRLRLTGDLTIRGVTREAVFEVEGPTPPIKVGNNVKMGVSATARINRKDFGLLWNRPIEAGGVVVGDEVTITIDVELNKKTTPAPTAPASQ